MHRLPAELRYALRMPGKTPGATTAVVGAPPSGAVAPLVSGRAGARANPLQALRAG